MAAICEAATLLLVKDGLDRLTTIRIAKRAGVSVGTYYQYFPNKEALLISLVEKHLRPITKELEATCKASHGKPLTAMVSAFVRTYMTAQLERWKSARVIYRLAAEIGAGAILVRERKLVVAAISAMLSTSSTLPTRDLDVIAFTFFGAVSGATRAMLEISTEAESLVCWEEHLQRLGMEYLKSFELGKSAGDPDHSIPSAEPRLSH